MKKVYSFILVFLSLFILASCKEKISVEEGTFNIVVGETKAVSLKGFKPADATFVSLNEDIVLIDEAGNYLGVAPGLATINVTYKKDAWSFFVIVGGERITLNASDLLTVNINEEVTIEYTHNDPNGVTLKSLDEEIVTVDNLGLVKALKAGKVDVLITSNTNESISKTVNITVLGLNEILYDISFETSPLKVNLNETSMIKVTTNDSLGVTFESTNKEVVTVDDLGNVKGLKEGSASIVVTSVTNPNVSKSLSVTVVDNRSAEEKDFTEAISNTVNLDNYTLEIYVIENYDNNNYYATISLLFASNLTMLKASQIEQYYEVIDGKQYIYEQTPNGFVKEEVEGSVSDGFLLYENFTFDAFVYNEYAKTYTLNTLDPENIKLLDDFIGLFAEEGVILMFELSLNEGLIDEISFLFIYDEYTFSIKMNIKDVGTTIVEVPENA